MTGSLERHMLVIFIRALILVPQVLPKGLPKSIPVISVGLS